MGVTAGAAVGCPSHSVVFARPVVDWLASPSLPLSRVPQPGLASFCCDPRVCPGGRSRSCTTSWLSGRSHPSAAAGGGCTCGRRIGARVVSCATCEVAAFLPPSGDSACGVGHAAVAVGSHRCPFEKWIQTTSSAGSECAVGGSGGMLSGYLGC